MEPTMDTPAAPAPTLTIRITPGHPHTIVINAGAGLTVTHPTPAAIAQIAAATTEAWLTGDIASAALDTPGT
jgi:hypothetical protein